MSFPPLPNPPGSMRRLIGLAKAASVVSFLGSTLLWFNLAQTSSLAIRPLSRRTFRRINRFAANTWWGWCVDWGEGLHGARVVWTGDDPPVEENAIVLSNHQQMSDIPFLMFLARDKKRLGDMKWMVKDPVKYVPGIGWGMAFLDCVFVKRNWAEDRSTIEATFARLTRDRVPVWLLSFPEGTRITPRKHAKSLAYAAKTGKRALDHLLLPRTKGFVATVHGLRGLVTAVYDVTIGYPDGVPSLWQYVQGFAPRAHLHVRRFPIESLPQTDDELRHWLTERFAEKDQLLSRFRDSGSFVELGAQRAPSSHRAAKSGPFGGNGQRLRAVD